MLAFRFNLFYVDQICLFTTALRSVTTDESFSVPSPANKKASETASALFGWCDCPHNHVNLSVFTSFVGPAPCLFFKKAYLPSVAKREDVAGLPSPTNISFIS